MSDTDITAVLRARGLRKHYGYGKDWCGRWMGSTSMSPPARRWR